MKLLRKILASKPPDKEGVKAAGRGAKIPGQDWSLYAKTGKVSPHCNAQAVNGVKVSGVKAGGDWFGPGADCSPMRRCSSGKSGVKQAGLSGEAWFNHGAAARGGNPRKAASAQIAKIPFPLSSYIARALKP